MYSNIKYILLLLVITVFAHFLCSKWMMMTSFNDKKAWSTMMLIVYKKDVTASNFLNKKMTLRKQI